MGKNTELLEYIYNQRWCNFKDEITDNKVENLTFDSGEFDNHNTFFIIGNAEIQNVKSRYFIMPLTKNKVEGENYLNFNNIKMYDAVKSPNYWSELMGNISLEQGFKLSNNYTLLYQSWDDFDFIVKHISDKSKPIGAEQSNSTLIIGNNLIAFKQQRVIEFSVGINPEVEMNYNLMKTSCKVVPKTFGYLSLIASDGKTAFAGIVQEFIKNNGDLWEILKQKLLEILEKTYASEKDIISLNDYKNLLNLMKLLGKKTNELLKCLKSFKGNTDIEPENITTKYIKNYKKSIKEFMKKTKLNIQNNINRLSSDMALNLQDPLVNWDKYIIDFLNSNFSKIEKRKNKGILMRVHGDFHLGQAIQTADNDIKFIDFSGEPNLDIEERKIKRSYMYDIAGMYRSISGYLPIVVSKKFALENENINNQKLIWASNIIKPIVKTLSDAFLEQLKIDPEWLKIEILRRNLYEINYEISYRPNMLFIPVDNLKELILGKITY